MTDPTTPLGDRAAREAIARDLDRTLFVEAGAGSGKTTSLVERLLGLVRQGEPISTVAAITFTEAAASELRTRVREALEAGADDPDAADDDCRRFREALDRLDEASITTLHSFARAILARHPVEAGLPPVLDLYDEVSSSLAFDDRWEALISRVLEDPDLRAAVDLGLALGIDVSDLRGVAVTMGQNWDLLEGADHPSPAMPESLDPRPVVEVLEEVAATCETCTDPGDRLYLALCDQALPYLEGLRGAGTDVARVLAATSEPVPSPGYGVAKSWPDDGKPRIKELLAEAEQRRMALRQGVIDVVLQALGSALARFTVEEADRRRLEGRLEFHDLLVLARRLLRSSPDAQAELGRRHRRLLIDEFQDTDPIQVELGVRIAAAIAHPADVEWDAIDVEQGRMFFVGDPKQSIYRFRRADIELFTATRDRFVEQATELTTNFRSVPGIVDAVNRVFRQIMVEEPGAQPAYAPLLPHRPSLEGDPGPEVLTFGGPHDLKVDAIREQEALDVAALARTAVAEGWLVDDDRDGVRPARLGDIAILIPARTSLPYLERALEAAGVPYRTETGSLVYSTAEVHELLAILRAIDDAGDRIAVVGALRSSAYGCGDDDLHSWRAAGGRWSYLAPHPAGLADHPVATALADLRQRHDRSRWQTVSEVVESLVRERRLMELALIEHRPRDVWRRYRVLIDQARQFVDSGGGRLREFLRWAHLLRSETVRVSEPVLPEADLDAVRIGTVHGSKGLEYPIVIVAGVTVGANHAVRGTAVELRRDGTFALRRSKDVRATDFDDLRTAEERMDEHERIRLLYVALTRARDHLLVSCHHKLDTPSHGQRLHGVLHEDPDVVHFQRPDEIPALPPAAGAEPAPAPEVPAARSEVLQAARRAGAVAATGVGRLVDEPQPDGHGATVIGDDGGVTVADPLEPPDAPPWRRGRAGTSIGRAVHSTLEMVGFDHDPDLDALAAGRAAAEGVADLAAEVAAKVRAALASDVVRAAAAAPRCWREVPVAAPAGGDLVLEGFVDLLYEQADGSLVVVDYKTDSARSAAELDRALERYTPQGAAYALALERATGRPVARVVFLFLRGGEAVEREVPDLRAAIAEVEAVLARVGVDEPAATPVA